MNAPKNLITRAAFDDFCNGPFQASLQILSIQMPSTNQKFKQAASRALGYSCYEQLLAGWRRVEHIQKGFFLEFCPVREAMTIKAKNIIMMFDMACHTIVAVSLRPGEEGRKIVTTTTDDSLIEDNWDAVYLPLPVGAHFDFTAIAKSMISSVDLSLTQHPYDTVRAALEFTYPDATSNRDQKGFIELQRTGEGVIADLYLTMDGEDCVDSIGVMFNDRQEDVDGSDAVQLHLHAPLFGGHLGEYYKWLKPDADDDGNARLLYINPQEEICISELQFNSAEDAIKAIEDNDWGYDRDEMIARGAVLVKITQEIIPSPY